MSERKPRKPLIERGSVLGDGPDILSSVLNAYADKTGQAAPFQAEGPKVAEPQSPEPTPAVVEEERAAPQAAAVEESKSKASRPSSQPADKPAKSSKPLKAKRSVDAEEDAKVRADTPKRLCSYRIPEGLDDWLEEHAFEHRHSGLKKQDLVAQAIQLLIVTKAANGSQENEG